MTILFVRPADAGQRQSAVTGGATGAGGREQRVTRVLGLVLDGVPGALDAPVQLPGYVTIAIICLLSVYLYVCRFVSLLVLPVSASI